jgi:hypothetical protein
MSKHFALKRKCSNRLPYHLASIFNFSHKILQRERDQKPDELRTEGLSRRQTPLAIMTHNGS